MNIIHSNTPQMKRLRHIIRKACSNSEATAKGVNFLELIMGLDYDIALEIVTEALTLRNKQTTKQSEETMSAVKTEETVKDYKLGCVILEAEVTSLNIEVIELKSKLESYDEVMPDIKSLGDFGKLERILKNFHRLTEQDLTNMGI